MVSLVDIAPIGEGVSIRGQNIECKGISAEGIARLIVRFPEMRALMSGRALELSPDRLLVLVPAAIGAIIAEGCGDGSEAHEAAANRLAVGEQMDLLEAIIKMTLPGGVGPFVEKLERLMALTDSGDGSKVPATK